MSDLFSTLVRRARGGDDGALTPALPSRFEPVPQMPEPWEPIEQFVAPARRPLDRPARASAPERLRDIPPPVEGQDPDLPRPPAHPVEAGAVATGPPPGTRLRLPAERAVEATAPLDLDGIIAEALRRRPRPDGEGDPVAERRREASGDLAASRRDREPPQAIVQQEEGAPAPRPAVPAASPDVQAPAAPAAIEVRIGRIEVTAVPPSPPRAVPPRRVVSSTPPALSLRDYLARRARK